MARISSKNLLVRRTSGFTKPLVRNEIHLSDPNKIIKLNVYLMLRPNIGLRQLRCRLSSNVNIYTWVLYYNKLIYFFFLKYYAQNIFINNLNAYYRFKSGSIFRPSPYRYYGSQTWAFRKADQNLLERTVVRM